MLNVLVRKRRLKQVLDGRAYRYHAITSRDAAMQSATQDLIDRVFDGSVEKLLSTLIEMNELDRAMIRRFKRVGLPEKAKTTPSDPHSKRSL